MEEAIVGVGCGIVVAILGSWVQLSKSIGSVRQDVKAIGERLDRADVEGLRDRVTRLETLMERGES
jgi:hypothetical protein